MFWEGKCFFCLFWSTLAFIVGISTYQIVDGQKKEKAKKEKTEKENTKKEEIKNG